MFTLIDNEWVQIGNTLIGERLRSGFGISVSLSADGTKLAVGAYSGDGNQIQSGYARVYGLVDEVWLQIGNDLDGDLGRERFGRSVNLNSDGDVLAVGVTQRETDTGYVAVFGLTGNVWVQFGQLIEGEDDYDGYGRCGSLSADGNRLATGAEMHKGVGYAHKSLT